MSTVNPFQGKDTYVILSSLWELCREVIYFSNEIDRDRLSDEDLAELEAIDRITIGYSVGLQEIGSAEESHSPSPAHIRDYSNLVQSHCYRALTALQATLNYQLGVSQSSIVLLEKKKAKA